MKKLVSFFFLLLILCSAIVSLSLVGVAKAQSTVYIRPDGSVDPPTDSIQRNGDVYTVMDNLDAFFVLERNNTVFDGAGHNVGGIYSPSLTQTDNQSQITNVFNITIVKTIINGDGIFLLDATTSVIANNTLNNGRGIDCAGNGNIIANNTVNSGRGIGCKGNGNIISGNHIINCGYTFVPENPSPYGVLVDGSNNNLIGNYIVGTNGTAINIGRTSFNNIIGNRIADNKVGIYTLSIYAVGGAHDNIIYCNNFINNPKNVENDVIIIGVSVNIWNFRSVGNYWSNYNGTDNDGDGIGDTPYVIDENNQDNYPLMETSDTCPHIGAVMARAIGGTISSDTKWTKANSPYDFVEDVLVSEGTTLTIEAGVLVNFHRYTIQVDGTLKVQGTPGDKVVIISENSEIDDSHDRIGSLNFGDESSNCVIENAVLETLQLTYRNCNSSFTLNNNYFKDQRAETLSGYIEVEADIRGPGNATITNNIFTGRLQLLCFAALTNNTFIGGGLDAADGSFLILNNTFIGYPNNLSGNPNNPYRDSSGISVDTLQETVISDNYFSNYYEACIRIIHGPALIQRNFIQNEPNLGDYPFFGITIDGTSPLIANNTIIDCGIGIVTADSGILKAKPTIKNNNIYNNKNFNLHLGYPERPGYNSIAVSNINAVNNWWGTTDNKTISQTIYDSNDRSDLGTVNFTSFLTAPNPQAAPNPNAPPSTFLQVPTARFIQATKDNGQNITLTIESNMRILWSGPANVRANPVTASTNVSFVVTVDERTRNFANVTIPTSAVPYGTMPTIYFENHQIQDQGHTQDDTNYYVWCTTYFTDYYHGNLTILFTTASPSVIPEFPSQIIGFNEAVDAIGSSNSVDMINGGFSMFGELEQAPFVEGEITGFLAWLAPNGTIYQVEYPSKRVLGEIGELTYSSYNASSNGRIFWWLNYQDGRQYLVDAIDGSIIWVRPLIDGPTEAEPTPNGTSAIVNIFIYTIIPIAIFFILTALAILILKRKKQVEQKRIQHEKINKC